jgi:hypothetical protein
MAQINRDFLAIASLKRFSTATRTPITSLDATETSSRENSYGMLQKLVISPLRCRVQGDSHNSFWTALGDYDFYWQSSYDTGHKPTTTAVEIRQHTVLQSDKRNNYCNVELALARRNRSITKT